MPENHKTDWKQFENFIGKIEEMLAEKGATVKTNDSIKDRYGNPRQVDASVRVKTGTTELLIIFECRKRKKMSDVTWVEQVVTKRDNLRANLAVIVSSKPISSTAKVMAKDKGIQTRDLTPIADINSLFMFPTAMESIIINGPTISLDVHFAPGTPRESCIQVLKAFEDGENVDMVFPGGVTKNLRQAIDESSKYAESPFIPPGSMSAETYVPFLTPNACAVFRAGQFVAPVLQARLVCLYKKEVVPSDNFTGHYLADDGNVDHYVARSTSEIEGRSCTFTTVSKRGSNAFTVHIPPTFGNEDVRRAMAPHGGAKLEVFIGPDGMPHMRNVP